MKIAVVQHRLRATAEEDAAALAEAARAASAKGAEFVVLPEVFSLDDNGGSARNLLYGALDEIEDGQRLIPHVGAQTPGVAFVSDPLAGVEPLGRPALVVGDACVSGTEWVGVLGKRPDFIVMSPRSENDLQAEAALEFAIGLSQSVAGLVIVCEPAGAELGERGHGGSAVVLLGQVVAEALGEDDLLIAEVPTPLTAPEPREPIPDMPTILKQRLAQHHGERPRVDYPADLSDGPGPR